jgi:hypothetical protein
MSKKTENTSNNPHWSWVMGGNPAAIERQEAEGQKELVESLQLPKRCNSPRGVNAAEQYAKMGIKVFTGSKGDDLFMGVKLPKGWVKKATDHSMWCELIDDKGRKRAAIFYKAAFYDRDAFINFETRYQFATRYSDEKDEKGCKKSYYVVMDGDKELYVAGTCDGKNYNELTVFCEQFLNENHPDWRDINAYWNNE